jgi:peptidoglycan/LPS O-acetylase OafA/YrhL
VRGDIVPNQRCPEGVSEVKIVNLMPTQKARLQPLTGVRFFLALWVVIFHQTGSDGYLSEYLAQVPNIGFCLVRTGYLAVGGFFVLSGFILSYNYPLLDSWSASDSIRFGIARFSRIYPAYFIGLLLVAPIVGNSIVEGFTPLKLAKEVVLAFLNGTLLQSWIPKTALTWNSPAWSLSNEAFFYACFPFVGVALWRLSRLRSIVVVGSVLWAAGLIVPLAAVTIPLSGFGDAPATSLHLNADPFWANFIKFNPLLRISDFCVGILLGRAYDELRRRNSPLLGRGYYLYVPGVILEILAIGCCSLLPYPLVHNGLFLPLHSLVILGLALGGGIPARFLSVRPLVFLGNASYSMYILHSPVSTWIHLIPKRFSPTILTGMGGMVLYLLVVLGLSGIVFAFFEEPANRILKRRLLSTYDGLYQKYFATGSATGSNAERQNDG